VKLNVTFETGHPARLEGLEGAVAVVFQDERPVQGVAVRADWRLNGFLSRLLMDGRFTGERGDWLLLHTQGRLPYTRLFLVGMGRKQEREIASSRRALAGIASKVALAGVHSFAIDLSEVIPAEMAADDAMVVFLEALSQAYPEDVESNPPYLPALNAREQALGGRAGGGGGGGGRGGDRGGRGRRGVGGTPRRGARARGSAPGPVRPPRAGAGARARAHRARGAGRRAGHRRRDAQPPPHPPGGAQGPARRRVVPVAR
jgi:hypothetical protein